MKQTESAAPHKAESKEEASITKTDLRLSVAFACEKLKHFLDHSRDDILEHVETIKFGTIGYTSEQDIADIMVDEFIEYMHIVNI